MAENTKIEWCHHTVNFWWGCAKVSPACANCYAESQAARFYPGHWGPDAPRRLRIDAARLEAMRYQRQAEKLGTRFRVFTNSMADFFEDRQDLDEARLQALDVIRQTPNLDWLILTKRPEKIMALLHRISKNRRLACWVPAWLDGILTPSNIWIGTTVEDQERADKRIPSLLAVPARVRFLSCEPLLGPVDLRLEDCWLGYTPTRELLHQVITGGESGPHARPSHPDWFRGLRDDCAAAGVPFLFKQWGDRPPMSTMSGRQILPFGTYILPGETPQFPDGFGFLHGKRMGPGRLLDGVLHDGYPEVRP